MSKARLVLTALSVEGQTVAEVARREQPNECWQSDFTHYQLAGGRDVEIITWLDDHSRYALSVTAHPRITGAIVGLDVPQTLTEYGVPASTLTDNGMVYTTRLSGGKGGRNGLETELRRLNIVQKNSRPNHPTTCGKVERFGARWSLISRHSRFCSRSGTGPARRPR
jgi:transposase InsO family protein